MDLYRDLGDRNNEATALTRLGDTYHALGDAAAARPVWLHALAILDELGHTDADKIRAERGLHV